MKDHMRASKNPPRRIVGVRELKTHAARILRHVRNSRASYVLTHRGVAVGVLLPLDPADGTSQVPEDADTWAAWQAFVRAGRRLEPKFRPGIHGVRILSGMRR